MLLGVSHVSKRHDTVCVKSLTESLKVPEFTTLCTFNCERLEKHQLLHELFDPPFECMCTRLRAALWACNYSC